MPKRLKSLDECGNVSIADSRKVNRILDEKAKGSATYNHNKTIFEKTNESNILPLKRENTFISKIKKLFKFVMIVILCFVILMMFNH